MAHRWTNTYTANDVTPKNVWMNRRSVLAGMTGLAAAGGLAGAAAAQQAPLEPNTLEEITSYNNFYEFGTGKDDPSKNSGDMITDPWEVTIDGMVENPGTFSLQDLIADMTMEERIYRFRCVEAWSMVVPWNGFELADLLEKAGVQSGATHVAFETAVMPEVMPGVRNRVIDFPYVEGLRLDEAMHPLTLMATGIYGEPLANQNGAPIRLVVPWKYGFKSIKSIVRITLTDEQPKATWNDINAREYGFYSNVNPEVDHPRWSQASERMIGGGLFASRQDTLMFNGYPEVASLYAGMDLSVDF
ncbi:protein-methionine-sulfoxide reductase catalytic subunit MsrP [Octadecabacter sp. 1_MG-2023]|uniref:protein-methionine-sulfoxide reductase catalytic subunit MsrP n=1 Tax=unclassified Octadecabacter TaxID=196158 RepID=UPI001C07FCC7|nr:MULTISPECIES: protein-methionine-sulfoxide reductase catalytic subunit MsrP [unclassified Octadecabacter]MBU2992077.1 protein-methionine-sulfoxide reductase catalytic subunit MsrP [Octadecabacter sp. B2R22]MDO6735166.1 protein-methionine-sulfoxide reductase catalytic subunit MsrP [Octadecabacter sp. 1_MG-2023]